MNYPLIIFVSSVGCLLLFCCICIIREPRVRRHYYNEDEPDRPRRIYVPTPLITFDLRSSNGTRSVSTVSTWSTWSQNPILTDSTGSLTYPPSVMIVRTDDTSNPNNDFLIAKL